MESFIFEDKNEYEYEIKLNVLARVLRNKKTPRKDSFYFFSLKKLVGLFILKEEKSSPGRKMTKLLTFDNLFLPLRHSQ